MTSEFMLALVGWRENRSGQIAGMESVMNVVVNTARLRKTTIYAEITRPLRYSSITAARDPQLDTWPMEDDPQWMAALKLAETAVQGTLPDITDGSTNYFAASLGDPPEWTKGMLYVTTIAGQRFYR